MAKFVKAIADALKALAKLGTEFAEASLNKSRTLAATIPHVATMVAHKELSTLDDSHAAFIRAFGAGSINKRQFQVLHTLARNVNSTKKSSYLSHVQELLPSIGIGKAQLLIDKRRFIEAPEAGIQWNHAGFTKLVASTSQQDLSRIFSPSIANADDKEAVLTTKAKQAIVEKLQAARNANGSENERKEKASTLVKRIRSDKAKAGTILARIAETAEKALENADVKGLSPKFVAEVKALRIAVSKWNLATMTFEGETKPDTAKGGVTAKAKAKTTKAKAKAKTTK